MTKLSYGCISSTDKLKQSYYEDGSYTADVRFLRLLSFSSVDVTVNNGMSLRSFVLYVYFLVTGLLLGLLPGQSAREVRMHGRANEKGRNCESMPVQRQ